MSWAASLKGSPTLQVAPGKVSDTRRVAFVHEIGDAPLGGRHPLPTAPRRSMLARKPFSSARCVGGPWRAGGARSSPMASMSSRTSGRAPGVAPPSVTFVYRPQFGLSACTTANGCFKKIDQNGGTNSPCSDRSSAEGISLDLDMVSPICPNCHTLRTEATTNSLANLTMVEDTAAT
jgi:hypothetical protein